MELFDQKCLIKLNEVATSLLKLAPYDLDTMCCSGLASYVSVIFPVTDWSQVRAVNEPSRSLAVPGEGPNRACQQRY